MESTFIAYIPAIILAIVFAAQLFLRPLLIKRIAYFFWIPVLIIIASATYQSAMLYLAWNSSPPPGNFLLPPATPITYYLFYVLMRFWLPHLLALAFGGIAYLTAKYLNKRFGERFFYPEEYYLIALGFFLLGHPYWIGFLIFTILGYLLYTIGIALKSGSQTRASFYYLWLPAALIVALLTPWLKTIPFLTVLHV